VIVGTVFPGAENRIFDQIRISKQYSGRSLRSKDL